MKYHVEIDDAFWHQRFPDWDRMPSREKFRHSANEVRQIRAFLAQETPQGEVHLLVTPTGVIRFSEEGPVHVKPLAPSTHQG